MRDFLIIGGGMAGISAAARLCELGTVTVLETEDAPGYHATGRSAALWEAAYGAPGMCALNAASRPWFEAEGLLSPRGLMFVGTPAVADIFAADVADYGLAPLTMSEAREIWPILGPAVDRAGFDAEAFDIDTDRLLQGFLRQARANGAALHARAPATAIRRTASGWSVSAGGEDIAARILVNAAGAWADGVARLAGIAPLGLVPHRRSMARIAAPPGQDVARWPMVIGAGETWYSKPDAGALLVSPADEDPAEPHDAWADDMVLAEGLARFADHAEMEITRPIATWAGLRTFAPDRHVVLGPSPADPAFVWCAGQGGSGIQSAPAASALLADLVAGRPSALPEALVASLSAARFGP